MRNKLTLIIAILHLSYLGFSQDSLINLLTTDLPDTTRIDILGDISKSLFGLEIDSAINYAKEAVALAEKIQDEERQAYMLKNVGIGYYYKGAFVETLNYWEASLAVFEKINHPKGIPNLLGNIGSVYNSTGDYVKSLEYQFKTLRLAEKNKDEFRRATTLQNIGAVYSNMEDYETSQQYYEDALTICRDLAYEKGIATVVMNLSEIYRNIDELDKAAANIKEAKAIFEKLNDPSLPEVLIASSDLLFKQKKYSKAILEAKTAYDLTIENESKAFRQRALVTLGNVYNQIGKIQLAKNAFKEAIQTEVGVNIDLQQAYIGFILSHRLTGDYKAVSQAQDSLLSINKQLYNKEKNDNISNLQLEFDLEKRESEVALLNADNEIKSQQIAQAHLQRNFFSAIALFLSLLIAGLGYLYKYAQKKNKIISEERNKSDHLLKNILPPETAEELKKHGSVQPKSYDFTTVLFTDFVGFTKKAVQYSPEILVNSIDYYFKQFDKIIAQNHLEKIKTMGDAYMCAGGLHTNDEYQITTTQNTINAAAQILQFMQKTAIEPPKDIIPFQIRIGIDCGPVVAGVVGQSKFQYDIWGDTVNVAARMEANSEPNKINVSENIYQQLKGSLTFLYRGTIEVKNKGLMKMYFYV